MRYTVAKMVLIVTGLTGMAAIAVSPATAHCDTMDGPVVGAARAALAKGDVTPVLMWIKKDNEGEVRVAFAKALVVRAKSAEARDLADLYFFETVVRVHRQGEGEPYTGLRPTGDDPDPAIVGADMALESGAVDSLVSRLTESASSGIRERFRKTMETRKHAADSVEAGRKYVEAYVEFLHYTERLFEDSASGVASNHR